MKLQDLFEKETYSYENLEHKHNELSRFFKTRAGLITSGAISVGSGIASYFSFQAGHNWLGGTLASVSVASGFHTIFHGFIRPNKGDGPDIGAPT